MGYDEHYAGSDAGSVASIGFVKNGVSDTIAEGVPAEQIVLGMPFYTQSVGAHTEGYGGRQRGGCFG